MQKLDRKKISLDELKKVSGGTPEVAYAYLDEMRKKYGLEPGASLDDVMTDEEWDHFADLFWEGMD